MEKEHQPTLDVTEPRTSKETLVTSAHLERHAARQSESIENRPEQHPKRLWLIELWIDNRELFKEFVKHAIFFLLLLAGLESFHRLLNLSSLDPQELKLFGKLHLYVSTMLLLLFALSFIMKVLKFEWRDIKKW